MRIRSLLITMLGVAVAAGSVYASREFLAVDRATASADASTPALVSVVVAGQDIPFGTTIDAHKLTTIQWPAEAVPSGVFTDYTVLVPQGEQEPRRAKRAMVKGELILGAKLSDFGEKVTIGQSLSPGNRAIAISVNATTSVGGFVTPGDYVDVVLTSRDQRGLRAVTILQNLRVIGVDQQADELNEQAQVARTVTVEVTPNQGQKLALAQRAGTLSLTLRNIEASGEDEQPLESIRLSDIIQDDAPVVVAPTPKPTVKVRRGINSEEVELDGAGEGLRDNGS
ncbi:MAG: Flp pilus assembly protein CpaB [Pseudomonadota bacterium]